MRRCPAGAASISQLMGFKQVLQGQEIRCFKQSSTSGMVLRGLLQRSGNTCCSWSSYEIGQRWLCSGNLHACMLQVLICKANLPGAVTQHRCWRDRTSKHQSAGQMQSLQLMGQGARCDDSYCASASARTVLGAVKADRRGPHKVLSLTFWAGTNNADRLRMSQGWSSCPRRSGRLSLGLWVAQAVHRDELTACGRQMPAGAPCSPGVAARSQAPARRIGASEPRPQAALTRAAFCAQARYYPHPSQFLRGSASALGALPSMQLTGWRVRWSCTLQIYHFVVSRYAARCAGQAARALAFLALGQVVAKLPRAVRPTCHS